MMHIASCDCDIYNPINFPHFSLQSQISSTSSISKNEQEEVAAGQPDDGFGSGDLARQHRLWPEVDNICTEQLHYARRGVGEGANGWQLFADEGEMKMYRREQEVDGMVVDPLKACHVVKGVSAREMCHYFFMPEYRNDWESECCICKATIKVFIKEK